ncbi:MAG: transcription termination factor NusA [Thermoflexus sp.]|uniref:transcription termination factor NusA n=1 Tax=Thermoflexus sp. TaxID=1969742 RepID=UPI0025D1A933|nr:transcription termination factor NusA [Thermoflexus sp.]MCS6964141.1 transcription termination factor NusA [Thermoflexus sp.]MDW8185152.1 transcription termination factor NusA [Anaerolineae bacterium]
MAKSELLLAVNQIAADRNLPREIVLEVLKGALATVFRRMTDVGSTQAVDVEIDLETGQIRVFLQKTVVEVVEDPRHEISLEEARRIRPDIRVGEIIRLDVTPANFAQRIAAQNVRQIVLQRIREAERDYLYRYFSEQEGEIVHGVVQAVTPQGATVLLAQGRAEAILPRNQMVPGERLQPHQRIRAYLAEVRQTPRGPQLILSRSHKNLIRRLLETEVPEIYNGLVEIKAIAREPGQRTKVAVAATQPNIDAVGACIGQRGMRIQNLVHELGGEKIDVIEWHPDPAIFIAKALSPARVLTVHLFEEKRSERTAQVVVPDDQLSLAIGREGLNARLAARLTGWRIDIHSLTEALEQWLPRVADPELQERMGEAARLIPAMQEALARHKSQPGLPWSADELRDARTFLEAAYQAYMARREAERARRRAQKAIRVEAPEIPLEKPEPVPQETELAWAAEEAPVLEPAATVELAPSIPETAPEPVALETVESPLSGETVLEARTELPVPEPARESQMEPPIPEPAQELSEAPFPIFPEPERVTIQEDEEEEEAEEEEEEIRRRKKAGKGKERRRVRYEIDYEDETWLRRMRGGRVRDWLEE